jgi:multidrug resistance efflux pump
MTKTEALKAILESVRNLEAKIASRDAEIEALHLKWYESKHCQCGYDDVCEFAREAESLRKDAERYRWLRNSAASQRLGVFEDAWDNHNRNWLYGKELDCVINVAMAAGVQK